MLVNSILQSGTKKFEANFSKAYYKIHGHFRSAIRATFLSTIENNYLLQPHFTMTPLNPKIPMLLVRYHAELFLKAMPRRANPLNPRFLHFCSIKIDL